MASTPSTSSTLDNHASPAGSTLGTSISSASSQHGDDGSISAVNRVVSCRWGDCRKTYDDPEDLYHHLCNDHVGRKSTNNLCLSCKWEGCDVTCAKRDHITSHLRVHTPLKPHSCDACGKLFKRPQDLKKHERIHTEQHFQARQLKYQPPTMGMPSGMPFGMHGYSMQPMPAAAAAAAAAAASHGSGWSHYSHNAQPSGVPSYNSNYMYPSLPGHRSQSLGNSSGPGFYPMVSPRHPAHLQPNYPHTPAQGDAASNNSLSPLSSHLGTPSGSGSSPASQQYYKQQAGGERSYLGMQPSRPKAEDDPNSYSYLSQGSSLAGSKRSHDATASFLDDVRRKRMAPTYDEGMAERIDDSFAHGIDDASLEAILTSLGFSDPAQAAAAQQQQQSMQVPSQSQAANRANMSLPDALKTTDLAELNAFLLQVGASASRGMGQEQSTPNTTTPTAAPTSGSEFDFQSALAAAGLDSIPGLDENLFRSLSEPDISYTSSSNPANIGQSLNRPIAQLPHRASTGTTSSQSPFNPMTTSFDSVRVPRGQPYVPQLGVKDMSTPLYRHVEPLMRAAPTSLAERSTSAPLRSTAGKDGSDGNDSDEAMEEGGDEHTSAEPLRPATAKSPVDTGRSLYSRIPRPDPARRLPMPSLGSVASASRDWRESHASHVHPASRSPSPPPTSHSSRQRRMSSSSSSTETSSSAGTGLYPRLAPLSRNATRDGSMEGIATDVAALDVAGSAAASEHGSDDSAPAPALSAAERRQQHVQAILHLLVALNRRRPERKGSDGSEDSLTPPAAGQPARSAHEDAAALPSIRNLLHDVDSREAAGPTSARSHELLGAGGRRIMDIDV